MVTAEELRPTDSLYLLLTEACNLRCKYCFVNQKPKNMSYEMAFDAMNWVAKSNPDKNFSIIFFGGEPTIRWHEMIVPLVIYGRQAYGNRVDFSITTNGLLLDEEKLKFMKKYNINFLLSFDGCKDCMDINRPLPGGASAFDVISLNIPKILEYQPNTTMRATIFHETVDYVFDSYKFAVDNGFKHTFFAIDTFTEFTEDEFKILESELYKVADLYIELYKQGNTVIFDPMIRQQTKKPMNCDGNCGACIPDLGMSKCGVGSNGGVALTPNGDLFTCQEAATTAVKHRFYVGNIYTGVDNEKRADIINSIDGSKIRCEKENYCDECLAKSVCDGGCMARNYEQFKDFNIQPYNYCRYENIMWKVNGYIKRNLPPSNISNDQPMPAMFS
jgi:uncharacterized protein